MSKRWQVQPWTGGGPMAKQQFPSQVKAYEAVRMHETAYLNEATRVQSVVVLVSENKGPWQTYERLRFTREGRTEENS